MAVYILFKLNCNFMSFIYARVMNNNLFCSLLKFIRTASHTKQRRDNKTK